MNLPQKGAAALAAAALALAASACGDGGGAPEAKEFTFWSMHKQDEPRAKMLNELAAAFTKDTGIKVNLVFQGRENLKKLQPTLVGGNVAADLVDGSQANLLNLLQVTGHAKDLSALLKGKIAGEDKTIGEVIPDNYEKVIADAGKTYMIPTSVHTWQIYYNAAKLPDVAANPPKTFEELLALFGKSKAAGRAALAADGDIQGYVGKWLSQALLREFGPGNLAKALTDRSGAGFDDPRFLKAATYIESLAKGEYMIDGWDASKFPAIQQKWAQGQADFLFIGTYGPSETAEVAGPGFTFRSFPFPKTEGGFTSEEVALFGFAVPAKARHAENAEKFVEYFMNKKWLERIPADEKVLSVRSDTSTPAEVADAKATLDSGVPLHLPMDGVRGMDDWNVKIFLPMAKDLFAGKVSAKDFVTKLKTDTVDWWKVNG
ncbi:ABC transporter substrate-binding protein [Nonomuraea angiospora]|uniref:ABC transporter substrate-binding protein n=1 Tax=Nonomuraea angiospora TaxID=46172 RepID=UPI00299FC6F7|nr:ABC transporter substrate-binding protein [Nonomuraea angiospora]MDX3103703.1 ABC transporter substrate-binding protein [Nonomuraea angiospora]